MNSFIPNNQYRASITKFATGRCTVVTAAFTMLLFAVSANGQDSGDLRRALSGPDREVTDYVRDEARKPVEVLEFLGIGEGMAVLDVYAAGGYYTYILSKAVGEDGHVYAQNTERGMNFREDRQDISQGEALAAKIERGNLSNVELLIGRVADVNIAAESLDAILLMQTLHDSYNGNPARALNLLLTLKNYLKPGGIIGITDHVGLPDNDNRDLHRMQIDQAVDVSEQAGFIVQSSGLLRNPRDDHSRSIFDPRLARNTDRFLLRLIKPD